MLARYKQIIERNVKGNMTMIRFFITYTLDGLTEYSSDCGVMDSYATKLDAQRALKTMKLENPHIKRWRIVQARV